MVDQYIQQLRNPDPDIRRTAIVALANSDDPRATDYLAKVAQNDPVTSLRVLAERAHRHSMRKGWRAIDTEAHDSSGTNDWYSHIEKANAEINDSQRRARAQLNNAHGSVVNGDTRGALNYLVNAFELDPGLMQDKGARALTSEITGVPVDEAVEQLMSEVPKQKKSEGPTSLGTLMTYIFVEAIILYALLAGLAYLILSGLYRGAVNTPAAAAELRAQLIRLGGAHILFNAAAAGGILLLAYLVYFVMMFGVAMMMGGFGTIFDYFNVILRVYIVLTIETVIVFALVALFRPSPDIFSGISIGLTLINTCVVAYFAAREMNFGFFRGLLTVFAPQILACMLLLFFVVLGLGNTAVHFFSNLPG